MTPLNDLSPLLDTNRLIALIEFPQADWGRPYGEALVEGGVGAVQIPVHTDAEWGALRAAVNVPGLVAGAGTVVSVTDVDRAHDLGAAFITTPGIDTDVIERALTHHLPVLAGVATPTDVLAALKLGLTTLYFFPSGPYGGHRTLQTFHFPFPQVSFVPDQDVDAGNLGDYLALPNVPAVSGAFIVPHAIVNTGDPDQVRQAAATAVALADQALALAQERATQ
ncbi:MAG: keto-deoxy-phosphogluconate aldolase [Propionibacteriaceae bacterium]|jgi:2-dehydro-3-deoxyphosphogluconate aldolase/(4S)-4-hydroxy-2-oxoglutarate aldolase|nr:keto-deoxy-phosphogluconate aldolase [Propionibacteriaceae bacterium]